MLTDQKILITGAAGQIGLPMTRFLAADNEVWGLGRYTHPDAMAAVAEAGATPVVADLASGRLDDVPTDFTHVVHLAASIAEAGDDYDAALATNAEGTGFLLHHCRGAKSALVMSTHAVYTPDPDPWHVYPETAPLGGAVTAYAPTYSASKLGQEAVARSCARTLGLPVTIGRMNASYGGNGGLFAYMIDMLRAGMDVTARHDPNPYCPIHEDDINRHVAALLDAASVPATIVNWAGDDPISVQDWCAAAGEALGVDVTVRVDEVPGSHPGLVADVSRRRSITGPCTVAWQDGLRRTIDERS